MTEQSRPPGRRWTDNPGLQARIAKIAEEKEAAVAAAPALYELPCIICGRTSGPACVLPGREDKGAHPSGALVFASHGGYGSDFDPFPLGEEVCLQIVVCDGCVYAAATQDKVLYCRQQHPPTMPVTRVLWQPPEPS